MGQSSLSAFSTYKTLPAYLLDDAIQSAADVWKVGGAIALNPRGIQFTPYGYRTQSLGLVHSKPRTCAHKAPALCLLPLRTSIRHPYGREAATPRQPNRRPSGPNPLAVYFVKVSRPIAFGATIVRDSRFGDQSMSISVFLSFPVLAMRPTLMNHVSPGFGGSTPKSE